MTVVNSSTMTSINQSVTTAPEAAFIQGYRVMLTDAYPTMNATAPVQSHTLDPRSTLRAYEFYQVYYYY